MCYLGVDVGATFVKGAVLDLEHGVVTAPRRVPFPAFLPERVPGAREVDTSLVAATVWGLIDELLAHAPHARGVVMCSQMHGFVLADDYGRPLTPFVSWQDQRAGSDTGSGRRLLDDARNRLGEHVVATGDELRVGSPVAVLFAMREAGELPAGAHVLSLPDFLVSEHNGRVTATDPTQAAATGAWDVARGEWHRETIAALGLDRLRWPAVGSYRDEIARITVGGAVRSFFAPVGDQQCALLGTAVTPDEVSVNVATGSQVSMLVPTPDVGSWQRRPYFDGHFLRTVTHLPAGRALNALVHLLTELGGREDVDVWGRIDRAVSATPTTDVAADIAFFDCTVGTQGALTGLREESLTVGHVFRAVFEQMARTYADAAHRLDRDQRARRVVFSGGLIERVRSLADAIDRRIGLPVRRVASEDATLVGLLALATAIDGRAPDAVDAANRLTTWATALA